MQTPSDCLPCDTWHCKRHPTALPCDTWHSPSHGTRCGLPPEYASFPAAKEPPTSGWQSAHFGVGRGGHAEPCSISSVSPRIPFHPYPAVSGRIPLYPYPAVSHLIRIPPYPTLSVSPRIPLHPYPAVSHFIRIPPYPTLSVSVSHFIRIQKGSDRVACLTECSQPGWPARQAARWPARLARLAGWRGRLAGSAGWVAGSGWPARLAGWRGRLAGSAASVARSRHARLAALNQASNPGGPLPPLHRICHPPYCHSICHPPYSHCICHPPYSHRACRPPYFHRVCHPPYSHRICHPPYLVGWMRTATRPPKCAQPDNRRVRAE